MTVRSFIRTYFYEHEKDKKEIISKAVCGGMCPLSLNHVALVIQDKTSIQIYYEFTLPFE